MVKFVVVYLYNILIYSRTENKHLNDLEAILKALEENDLYTKWNKCTFLTSKLIFLGYIVSSEGIHVDNDKVKAVRDRPSPKILTKV